MAKPQVPRTDIKIEDNSWIRWFTTISDRSVNLLTFTATIAPALVAANITAEQTLTVSGLLLDDIMISSSYPTHDAGIVVYNVRVTADDQVKINYGNVTAGGITPTSQVYTFYIIRK
jgi:hypothetical protein